MSDLIPGYMGSLVIFSTPRATHDTCELVRDAMRRDGIRAIDLMGSWQGKDEPAFAAPWEDVWLLEREGWLAQECEVLKVTALASKAYTYQVRDGRVQNIAPAVGLGTFREVPREVARSQPGWTYDPRSKRYYVAGPLVAQEPTQAAA